MSTSTGESGVNRIRNPVDSHAEPVGLEGYPRCAGDFCDFGDRGDIEMTPAILVNVCVI